MRKKCQQVGFLRRWRWDGRLGGYGFAYIRGVFPKDSSEWLNWISQGKSKFLDKEKIQALINQQRKTLAEVKYLDLDDVTNIVQNLVNPTIEGENTEMENCRRGWINKASKDNPSRLCLLDSNGVCRPRHLVGCVGGGDAHPRPPSNRRSRRQSQSNGRQGRGR